MAFIISVAVYEHADVVHSHEHLITDASLTLGHVKFVKEQAANGANSPRVAHLKRLGSELVAVVVCIQVV